MVNGRFEGASPGDFVDQQLQQRAEETQRCLPQSFQRRLALNRLVNEILKSGRLGHPQRNLWSSSLYEDLYNEALQRTLLEICQKIDRYNPNYPVMAWVNFRLNYQFIDVVNNYRKQGMTQVPKAGGIEKITNLSSLDDLNIAAPVEDTFSNDRLLRQFLEEDPDNFLKKQQLRDRPEITFQSLAMAKFVEGKTWTELATDLEVSVQTLCSFFNRQLKELMPYFKKYLRE